mmetsp:Transcript_9805/g.18706  ORF Transcript_9805/g.18706 Transcript_9805/m.18706 type:complete len:90 (+) Transcript_9805:954-1223(+)
MRFQRSFTKSSTVFFIFIIPFISIFIVFATIIFTATARETETWTGAGASAKGASPCFSVSRHGLPAAGDTVLPSYPIPVHPDRELADCC